MNSGQRIALIVVTLVVLAGGFFLLRGSSDESSSGDDVTRTSTGTSGAQAPASTAETEPAETEAETQTQEERPAPRVETIRIKDGKPASGKERTLKYDSGETVRLKFTSNTAAEVHIHGYDETVEVPAGGDAVSISFKANAEGIFEIEEHHTDALLANLEVRP